jgi:hypothetical protein
MKTAQRRYGLAVVLTGVLGASLAASVSAGPAAPPGAQREFATPEDAIRALVTATGAKDKAAVESIFGPGVRQMFTGDDRQDAANFARFAKAVTEYCKPTAATNGQVILEIGPAHWPFPIPLVDRGEHWFFDTAAGKDEIISRHIGRDELHAIALCRDFVGAERRFASQHPTRNGARIYASGFKPSPPLELNPAPAGQTLPSMEGLLMNTKPGSGELTLSGYRFKILTRQGRSAPGGKQDYMLHGQLSRGFGLVAYPVVWGKSGIMTFIVNQDGEVYQQNLGENTVRIASSMKEYNPASDWSIVEDKGIAQE